MGKTLFVDAARMLFKPMAKKRARALRESELLIAITSISSSAEYLADRQNLREGGTNDWEVIRKRYEGNPVMLRALDSISQPRVTTAIHATRVGLGVYLLLPGHRRWRGAAHLLLAGSNAALSPRHLYGSDGSDQLATLVHAGLAGARLATRESTQDAFIWFVALQSNLSYLVSGWVKLMGPSWRSGEAFQGVIRTESYGHRLVYALLERYPLAGRMVGYSVLALECLFPILYLREGRLARPVLLAAASFHAGTGVLMGLSRFTTSFIAMHPLVAFTASPAAPLLERRDDTVLKSLLAGIGVLAAAGASLGVRRRLVTLDAPHRSRRVETSSGNEIEFAVAGPRSQQGTVFLVSGLAAPAEHMAWIRSALLRTLNCEVVAYARAGYASSVRGAAAPYRLEESVDDLLDLIDDVAPDRPVVLVGHSLGGEIARRAAVRLAARCLATIYLDPAHPGELVRSPKQKESAPHYTTSLKTIVRSVRCGMGALLSRPAWVDDLPQAQRRRLMAQYADARQWSAARREWQAVYAEFLRHDGPLSPAGGDAIVISSQRSLDDDELQQTLHDEIAKSHVGSSHAAGVAGSDHDSILTDPLFAAEAVRTAVDFLATCSGGGSSRGFRSLLHVGPQPAQREGMAS